MNSEIKITVKGKEYSIPNSWESVSPTTWLNFCRFLGMVEHGELSVGELRIRLLCDLMGWQWRKMRSEEQIQGLIVLSEQLTFPFKIKYKDDGILEPLTNEQYAKAVRTEPEHLYEPWAAPLQQTEWQYQPDLCFFRQMMPTVTLDRVQMFGYKASMHHGALSTSLTALQYIEASEALQQQSLPWLAAILYNPEPYDSHQAHALAEDFARLDAAALLAIRQNFEAVTTFLFQKTPFSLLTKFEKGSKVKSITTTMGDALYDLCNDGLGNSQQVEQMNLLTYLRILRKKTIDSVRQLHGMKMDIAKIANETGLPPDIITQII